MKSKNVKKLLCSWQALPATQRCKIGEMEQFIRSRTLTKVQEYTESLSKSDDVKKAACKLKLEAGSLAHTLALLYWIRPGTLHYKKECLEMLTCHSDRGPSDVVVLSENLQRTRHVALFNAKFCDKSVVVKWYKSGPLDTTLETDTYKEMHKRDCETPWFSTRFRCFGNVVLVMQELTRITHDDDPLEVGRQVVPQLKTLHEFTLHNDMKPSNILKVTPAYEQEQGKPRFFVIDYGGIPQERMKHSGAWKRRIWSDLWTAQKKHGEDQETYPYFDLLELGYTMNALAKVRKDKGDYNKLSEHEIKCKIVPELLPYMKIVAQTWKLINIPDHVYTKLAHSLQPPKPLKRAQSKACKRKRKDDHVQGNGHGHGQAHRTNNKRRSSS